MSLTAAHSPIIFVVSALLLVLWKLSSLLLRRRLNLPVAEGEAKDGDYTPILMAALEKYPDQPFVIPMESPVVILPQSMVDAIKNLPRSQASFTADVYTKLHGRYTGLGTDHSDLVAAIKDELTRGISKTLFELQDEVDYAFETEIGPCEDWTEQYIYGKLLRIVALISGRVFVGLPLCRDEAWINASIDFTIDVMAGVRALEKYPGYLRPLLAAFDKSLAKLKGYRQFAAKHLEKQVNEIVADRKLNGTVYKPKDDDDAEDVEKNQYNMVHWQMNHIKDLSKVDATKVGEEQMLLAFAAIHTTSMTACAAILDLAEHPEYVAELRAEIEEVIADEGFEDGRLRKTSMPKLRKLDSFIRESQRFHPLGFLTMTREVTAPSGLTIPSGHHLPLGTSFAFAHPYQRTRPTPTLPSSLLTSDPGSTPLSQFDPFRFSRVRDIQGQSMKHQFVTTGPENLGFGHGLSACPGRFFASNEIKVVLVQVLRGFDVAFGPGGEGAGEVVDGVLLERPKPGVSGSSYYPDPYSKVYFKKVAAGL